MQQQRCVCSPTKFFLLFRTIILPSKEVRTIFSEVRELVASPLSKQLSDTVPLRTIAFVFSGISFYLGPKHYHKFPPDAFSFLSSISWLVQVLYKYLTFTGYFPGLGKKMIPPIFISV